MIKGQRSRRDDREVPTQKRGNKTTKKILGSQSAVKMQQQMPPFGGKRLLLIYLLGAQCQTAAFRRRAPPTGIQ